MSATETTPPLTEPERNAIRAYLQRSEVRMSTLHRIATAFIGGAGLLILIPIFFKDAIDGIIEQVLRNTTAPTPLTITLMALLGFNLIVSLWIPIYSLYLLLKDIIKFYFSLYAPNFDEGLAHPTFSMNAIAFPIDESPNVKREVMRFQYNDHHINYMIPFSESMQKAYFDDFDKQTEGLILPHTRSWETLQAQGILDPSTPKETVTRFNVAFGITRSTDRTLIEEVAMTEMLMVRNVMYLRRLVLRYAKALLMFIWTTLISFIMLPFLKDSRLPLFGVLAIGYLVWSLAVMPLMRTPMSWLTSHRSPDAPPIQIDAQMTVLEDSTIWWVRLSRITALIALLLWFLAR